MSDSNQHSRPPADIVREALDHVRYNEHDGYTPKAVGEAFESLLEQFKAVLKERDQLRLDAESRDQDIADMREALKFYAEDDDTYGPAADVLTSSRREYPNLDAAYGFTSEQDPSLGVQPAKNRPPRERRMAAPRTSNPASSPYWPDKDGNYELSPEQNQDTSSD